MTYEAQESNTDKIVCMQCQRLFIKSHVFQGQIMIVENVKFWDEDGHIGFFNKAQRHYLECSNFHKWFIDREIKT